MCFKLNDNIDHVNRIREGLEKKHGHCPCQIEISSNTICPCVNFINTGDCHCKLYVTE